MLRILKNNLQLTINRDKTEYGVLFDISLYEMNHEEDLISGEDALESFEMKVVDKFSFTTKEAQVANMVYSMVMDTDLNFKQVRHIVKVQLFF